MANEYSGTGGAGSNCFNLTAGAGTVAGATTLTGAPCITLVAGTNITLTGASPNQITIASGGGGGGGTVTSVAAAGTVNGVTLIAAPAPITGAGTITLGGTLAIDNGDWVGTDLAIINGGTGQSTAQLAINSLSAVAAAGAGEVLTKVGANAAWAAAAGGGTISGTIADTQVAFGTALDTIGGNSLFTFDGSTLEIGIDDATTDTVLLPVNIERTTAGAAAAGIGVGMKFTTETTAGNEIGSIIESVTTDVGAGVEDFDLVFKNMQGGAAATEGMRLTSAGYLHQINDSTDSSVSLHGDNLGFGKPSTAEWTKYAYFAAASGPSVFLLRNSLDYFTIDSPAGGKVMEMTMAGGDVEINQGALTVTTGNITSTAGVVSGVTVSGVTVTASGILQSQRGIQRAGVFPLVGGLPNAVDFATLGGANIAVNFSVIQLSGAIGEGVSITDPGVGGFPPGSMWTITGMAPGVVVFFNTGAPPYNVLANGTISGVTLTAPGDAVTFFTPDGITWNILSTAFTAAPL